MNAPTSDVLEAIKRIAARPEGQKILEYLQSNMRDTTARLAQERDPVTVRVLQGHAQVLTVLMKDWKP